jgi:tetratricopeptide (TPR) repeat protein
MMSPKAENYRAVADEYIRLGILDMADEYLASAVRIDPRDASAWHKKARLWRDWGWPHMALPPATRAVDLAPYSSEMRYTLSTVLQALGRHQEARAQYEMAVKLTPVTSPKPGATPDAMRSRP